jgi:competence protein ComEC
MVIRGNHAYTPRVVLKKLCVRRVSRVVLMTVFCLAVLCGIGLAASGVKISGWMAVFAVLLLGLCRRRVAWVSILAVIIVGGIVGIWRGGEMAYDVARYQQFYGTKVTVQGNVAEDPVYDDEQKVIMLQNITVDGTPLPGKMRIKSIGLADPRRGDKIEVTGKLFDGFGNYQASIYYAGVRIIETANSPVDVLRREFAARIYSLFPDMQAGLGLGFLVGLKSSVSPTLDDEMKLLGLTHIVVASGYNLTILVRLSRKIFAKSSHYQMTIASLSLIFGFVLITGFSPSMTRAAFVAGLSVVVWYYGRRVHPALLISFAAAVTGMINPLYVWSDLGWWLSFLAFGGVMLVAPLLQRRIFGDKEPKLIGQVVLETICAQITTLPLILLIFGNLSVLSVVANVLVVPLIPLAMLLTFIAGAIGPIVPYVAWPAIWLLGYICELVHLLAKISWASVPFSISLPVFIGAYVAIGMIMLLLIRKTKHDYLSRSVIE